MKGAAQIAEVAELADASVTMIIARLLVGLWSYRFESCPQHNLKNNIE